MTRLGRTGVAYNPDNFLRRFTLLGRTRHWSLRSLLVKLIKIGAKPEIEIARQTIARLEGK